MVHLLKLSSGDVGNQALCGEWKTTKTTTLEDLSDLKRDYGKGPLNTMCLSYFCCYDKAS